jgi:DNA modification methylase
MAVRILIGDVRERLRDLPDESVHCCVTSPPYFGLRDYGMQGQIGLEETPDAFVAELVGVFREVRRVLRKDGTLWLNIGDSYANNWDGGGGGSASSTLGIRDGKPGRGVKQWEETARGRKRVPTGLKPKDLIGIPWRVAFALQADGWYLRQDIIWHKPNPMPESVRDRCTKAHEYLFLLSKSERYWFDAEAISEPVSETPGAQAWRRIFDPAKQGKEAAMKAQGVKGGNNGPRNPDASSRNRRSVWTISTQAFPEAHFATFPPELPELCIKAGCPQGGTVLDPFGGAGTTGLVADRLGRDAILVELNPAYAAIAERRIHGDGGMFAAVHLEAAE